MEVRAVDEALAAGVAEGAIALVAWHVADVDVFKPLLVGGGGDGLQRFHRRRGEMGELVGGDEAVEVHRDLVAEVVPDQLSRTLTGRGCFSGTIRFQIKRS